MLVCFRSCSPKDHKPLLKLVIAYNRFEKNKVNRKSLGQGLDVLLRNPSQGKMWLMEIRKKPVGYALLTYNFELEYGGAEGVLRDLFVEKRFRNQGIGSLALYEIEDYCRERGMRAFQLQLPRRNRSAEVFYRKAGFRELPRRVMILQVRAEEVVQARRVSASKRR
ncbi:MAG TPA: GNAT family N-acetyltransferase [Terriglobales bacterium]|nr:GNAT family N-acetyltransferase [Terriglobales bacterium]